MLSSGIELMLIGMGIVYGFLALLVFSIGAMSKFVLRFFPDDPDENTRNQHIENAGVMAAISAAVHQYRKKHPKI